MIGTDDAVANPEAITTSPTGAESGSRGPLPYGRRERFGLIAAPLLLVTMLLLPPPGALTGPAWRTAAVGIFMAFWWITEAMPISVTSLVPLLLFPLLGIMTMTQTAAPYANPVIYLFMGGFVVALGMQRHGLHYRIALTVVRVMGVNPRRVVLGFMVATAFVSMWVSNTATAVMMLPIGMSVGRLVQTDVGEAGSRNFALTLMLGIAYASSIGGIGTLIGTPPNALLAAYMLETYGVQVGFAQWMLVGVPLVVIGLPLTWLLLTRLVYPVRLEQLPGGRDLIEREYARLGRMSRGERWIGAIFIATAALWIVRPLLEKHIAGLTDTGIAMAAALACFLVPLNVRKGEFLVDWKTAEQLPWGVLILFGGGLALADAVTESGLATWIGGTLGGVQAWPLLLVVVLVTALLVFLTELTSNTAVAAAFLPLVASLAIGLGENPLLLAAPAVIGASCAFMLPVATPPNAIVYSSGYVTVPQMARSGFWLNLMFIVLITILTYTALLWAFDVRLGVLPPWAR